MKDVSHLLAYMQTWRLAAFAVREREHLMVRTKFVEGRGSLTPALCVVGVAPRGDDEVEGRPFVSRVGGILEGAMSRAGLPIGDTWFTTIMKFRPASTWATVEEGWQDKERAPTKDEIKVFRQTFQDEMDSMRPRAIVALGSAAAAFFAERDIRIAEEHGSITSWRNYGVLLTYHPAYVLHKGNSGEQVLRELEADLKKVHGLLKDA